MGKCCRDTSERVLIMDGWKWLKYVVEVMWNQWKIRAFMSVFCFVKKIGVNPRAKKLSFYTHSVVYIRRNFLFNNSTIWTSCVFFLFYQAMKFPLFPLFNFTYSFWFLFLCIFFATILDFWFFFSFWLKHAHTFTTNTIQTLDHRCVTRNSLVVMCSLRIDKSYNYHW